MYCLAILWKDDSEIPVACLGDFTPQPDSTIILSSSSTWISYNLSYPFILNDSTIGERAAKFEVLSDFHLMLE